MNAPAQKLNRRPAMIVFEELQRAMATLSDTKSVHNADGDEHTPCAWLHPQFQRVSCLPYFKEKPSCQSACVCSRYPARPAGSPVTAVSEMRWSSGQALFKFKVLSCHWQGRLFCMSQYLVRIFFLTTSHQLAKYTAI